MYSLEWKLHDLNHSACDGVRSCIVLWNHWLIPQNCYVSNCSCLDVHRNDWFYI